METLGLNNRVLKTLSQSSAKAAVDILGMRLSTTIKDKFVEIMITETEAYGRKIQIRWHYLIPIKYSHIINIRTSSYEYIKILWFKQRIIFVNGKKRLLVKLS